MSNFDFGMMLRGNHPSQVANGIAQERNQMAWQEIQQAKAAFDERKAEKAKEEAQAFKTYVAMGEQLGLDKNALTTQDLGTVKGLVEGKIAKTKLEEAVQELKANAAFDTAQSQAFGNTLQAALAQGRGPIRPQPVKLEDLVAQIAATPGAARSRAGAGILERALMEQSNGAQAGNYMPQSFSVNGMNGIVSPRTGSIHVAGQSGQPSVEDRITVIDRKGLNDRKNAITKAMGGYLTPEVQKFYADELAAINGQLGEQTANTKTQNPNNKEQTPTPSDSDIAYLKLHPNMKAAFEKRFGAGSAAQYLK